MMTAGQMAVAEAKNITTKERFDAIITQKGPQEANKFLWENLGDSWMTSPLLHLDVTLTYRSDITLVVLDMIVPHMTYLQHVTAVGPNSL